MGLPRLRVRGDLAHLVRKGAVCEVGERDRLEHRAEVGPKRDPDVTELLGADWGFEHTVRRNLARVVAALASFDLPAEVAGRVREQAAEMVAALDAGPKTLGWRMRSRVGERIRWYQVPEEARQ